MTWSAILTTLLAGFIFPFLIIIFWPRLVTRYKIKGGFLACFIIVGSVWAINHGMDNPLISQSSSVFIDMGFSAGIGSIVSGLLQGKSGRHTFPLIAAALLGGALAGFCLALIF